MKILLTALVVLTSLGAHAQGYLHLTEGQSYTYSFSSIPYLGPGALNGPYGSAYFYFAQSNINNTQNVVLLQMFETSSAQTLLAERTISTWLAAAPTFPGANSSSLSRANAWQDVEGAVRVSVLSGEAYLGGVGMLIEDGPAVLGIYRLTVAVPEPSSCLLVVLGAVVAWCFFRKKPAAKN
jgi:hypothetical protein